MLDVPGKQNARMNQYHKHPPTKEEVESMRATALLIASIVVLLGVCVWILH